MEDGRESMSPCRATLVGRGASLALVAWALVFASVTVADISPVFFRVEATNDAGSGIFEVLTSEANYDPDTGTWSWIGSGEIMDGDTPVAALNSAVLIIRDDPQISLTYALTAGLTDTQFTLTTALLSFPSISNAEGLASVGMTLTERDGDSATLTGTGPNGYAYLAQYNGYAPTGTTFAEFIQGIAEPDAYGSENADENTGGFIPIGDPVGDASVQFSFELTANDAASSTSNYVITPEPAGLALLVLGLAFARRR
jgi:MYXO-CTERM domain-containing protein